MDRDELKRLHDGTLTNLLKILRVKDFLSFKKSPLPISIIVSAFYTTAVAISGKSYEKILVVINSSLNIIPDLLGFTLAGLTIIVAFGNTEYLKSLSRIKQNLDGLKPSLFQKMVAVFTWSILIQGVCLSFSFLISLIIDLNLSIQSVSLTSVVNTGVLFISTLLITYSVFLLPKTVLNVFRFGQGHHFKLFFENQKEDKQE
ncbi:MAG: hypothetical protein ABJN36_15565 [Cyclobacteriaceae bacterium]